jgi:hypothetical protein
MSDNEHLASIRDAFDTLADTGGGALQIAMTRHVALHHAEALARQIAEAEARAARLEAWRSDIWENIPAYVTRDSAIEASTVYGWLEDADDLLDDADLAPGASGDLPGTDAEPQP